MFKSFPYLAALCVIALGGFFIHSALKSARTAGLEQGRAECAENQNRAIDVAIKEKESIENEVRKIDDIDAYGLSLGILRPDEDR